VAEPARRLAVIGAGWAGLAAAVGAREAGHHVSVFEMAPQAGGRARSIEHPRLGPLDNGQHILIGAYGRTLALMRQIGVDPETVLLRMPLRLAYPDGRGLALPPGPPLLAFTRGVLAARSWSLQDRLGLLAAAARWLLQGFRCAPEATVATLCRTLPAAVLRDLIEPLCVAALNTPMAQASGSVFLRVLKDALFSGRGSADLLLPRQPLSQLLPAPAQHWLSTNQVALQVGRRAMALTPAQHSPGWLVDGDPFDGVVLACSAVEAARLTARIDAGWSAQAAALRYEPIVTAYLRDPQLRLPVPMMALAATASAPAQFAFDLQALGLATGHFAFVISGARPWTERGLSATGDAVLQQARDAFPGHFGAADALRHVAAEQRATFACTPALRRPPARISTGLAAAGDYVDGPYPATLEGAVRSGEGAWALALAAH